MEIQNINSTPITFGWHYKMHKTILSGAVKEQKLTPEIINILSEAVMKPDLDEFFMYGQKHFYYPTAKTLKSFLDITGTHNAKYLYIKHIQAMQNGDNTLDHAGRALHYLQDMTQPNHIESGSVFRKIKDAKMHHDFEMQTFDIEQELVDNANPVAIEANSFIELFNRVVEISKANTVPSNKNKENWTQIAQTCMDLAIGTTKKFIELLQKNNIC